MATFRLELKEAITAAKELGYGDEVVDQLRAINVNNYATEMKAIYAINRIMISARQKGN